MALAIIAGLGLWSVAAYAPVFGGDPEIHIIFARNLLQGHPLQFNPGEFSSGETSPVYMLLVAAMMVVLGAYVPLGMKLVGAASLAGLCFLIGRAARRQGASALLATVLGALPLVLPSTVFQAALGMENVLFACMVVLVLQSWLDGCARRTIAIAGLPLLFFLRPEAALLGLCLLALALLDRDGRSILALILGAAITFAALAAVTAWTGVAVQAPGLMRAALSRGDSLSLTVLGVRFWLDFKFVPFLLYCLPFAAVAWKLRASADGTRREAAIVFFLFVLPLLLHLLTLFPSTHFSRYFQYGYAVFFFLFARLMARADRAGRAPAGYILAAIAVLAVSLVPLEHVRRPGVQASNLRQAIDEVSPAFVRHNSDALYEALGRPPVPVVIAVHEVQIRSRLDERFVVRSLDGVVDATMRRFVQNGAIDYGGYLEARRVAYVFGGLPTNTGVCLSRKQLSPEPPTAPAEVYIVMAPRGCR